MLFVYVDQLFKGMDDILSQKPVLKENFYAILGCDELSTTKQIIAEYRARVRLYHPDKVPEDADAAAHFVKLKKIKDILCDEVMRQKYDHWLSSGICISFEDWCARSAHCTAMHWATSSKKEAMIEAPHAARTNLDSTSNFIATECTQQEPLSFGELRRKFQNYEI